MQTLADKDSPPRIVVRTSGVEHEFERAVGFAADGEPYADTAQHSAIVCRLAWSGSSLCVSPVAGGALRLNGKPLEATQALSLHDAIRCDAADIVIDRLAATAARASVYPLDGNATLPPDTDAAPREITTPADSIVVPDADLALDAAPASVSAAAQHRSRWQAAAWVALLLLALTFGALVLVQRVSLELSPDDASVRVPGTLFKWHAGKTVFVFPGTHRLVAERTGYRPAEATVDVSRVSDSRATLRLAKLPGRVTIDTGGVPAGVSVDGRPAGQAPAEFEIEAGPRTLTVRADRYLDQIVRLEVVGLGESQTVAVTMQPSFGVVAVASEPIGASIAVDGKEVGRTPARLELSAGVRRIALESPGLRPWQSSLVVQAGAETVLGPIVLGAADARLQVRSQPSGSEVLVGGALRGKTPLTVALSPGVEHEIVVTHAGYDSAQRRVFAEAGNATSLLVTLVPRLVKVTVAGEPADAEVLVDGELQGRAPLELQLPAARHRVEIRKAGFESYTTELVLAPGLDRSLRFDLVDPRDIVGNAAPVITTKSGIALKLVAGGVFQMGSGRREQGRRPNEGSRRVTLQRPFYLGVTEVTNEQFRRFRPTHNSGFVGGSSHDLDSLPVTQVSWNDAVEFCNWLSGQEGLPLAYEQRGGNWVLKSPVGNGYRLPTEGEWEYAARYAGQGRFRRYGWGDALPLPPNSGNLAGTEAQATVAVPLGDYRDNAPSLAKPKQFPPNALGLYDMTGNVSEWTTDRYSSFFDPTAATDPLGPSEGTQHVVRGANWRTNGMSELRLAWRDGADGTSDTIGFRVARYVAPVTGQAQATATATN
ncbi:MAG: SUMF1/EgtB/PvdO family nonheme iron enzyme [Steroidobacteraceae bacterium]